MTSRNDVDVGRTFAVLLALGLPDDPETVLLAWYLESGNGEYVRHHPAEFGSPEKVIEVMSRAEVLA